MTDHNTSVPRVIVRAGRETSLHRRHPWLFSGAIAEVRGEPDFGALVRVQDRDGRFLAWGHYSPHSQIRVRLVSWEESDDTEGSDFWAARLLRAASLREPLKHDAGTTMYRLVHAESDGVPGLIVDRYEQALVIQILSAGIERRRDLFADLLWRCFAPQVLYERSDVDSRSKEGLSLRSGQLRGVPLHNPVECRENHLRFLVDLAQGHKTGFYLDQRENRERFRRTIGAQASAGRHPQVLNVFSYTGGFAAYALHGGASHVVNIDSALASLSLGRSNLALNALDESATTDLEGDAFQVLRELRRAGESFDLIVLDPPKFASTQRDVTRASRGYKDINLQALHLLRPGGLLFTFSCSGAISADLFQKIVFGAALDSGRDVQIIGGLSQGEDHPIALTFPEGAYLKGLICRVV